MKKLFILSLLCVASFFASAQALNYPMTPVGCSDNRFCDTTADNQSIILYATSSSGGIIEVFLSDGTYYLGHGTVGLSVVNYPVYRQPNNDKVIQVTASWYTWVTKGSGSGKGGSATHTHWSLTDGSLLFLP